MLDMLGSKFVSSFTFNSSQSIAIENIYLAQHNKVIL